MRFLACGLDSLGGHPEDGGDLAHSPAKDLYGQTVSLGDVFHALKGMDQLGQDVVHAPQVALRITCTHSEPGEGGLDGRRLFADGLQATGEASRGICYGVLVSTGDRGNAPELLERIGREARLLLETEQLIGCTTDADGRRKRRSSSSG